MDRVSEIELLISQGELSAAQVFTQMKQLIPTWSSPSSKPEFINGGDEIGVLIDSNYGVGAGFYAAWSGKFQWSTGEDEGMSNIDGVQFEVYGWQYLPKSVPVQSINDNVSYIKLTQNKDGSVSGRGKSQF